MSLVPNDWELYDRFIKLEKEIAEYAGEIRNIKQDLHELKEQIFYTPAGLRDDVLEYLAQGKINREVLREFFDKYLDNKYYINKLDGEKDYAGVNDIGMIQNLKNLRKKYLGDDK